MGIQISQRPRSTKRGSERQVAAMAMFRHMEIYYRERMTPAGVDEVTSDRSLSRTCLTLNALPADYGTHMTNISCSKLPQSSYDCDQVLELSGGVTRPACPHRSTPVLSPTELDQENECRAQLQQAQRQYDWRKQPKQGATTSAKPNQGLGSWVVVCSSRRCDLWCVAVVVRTDLVAAKNEFSVAVLHHQRHVLGRAG